MVVQDESITTPRSNCVVSTGPLEDKIMEQANIDIHQGRYQTVLSLSDVGLLHAFAGLLM